MQQWTARSDARAQWIRGGRRAGRVPARVRGRLLPARAAALPLVLIDRRRRVCSLDRAAGVRAAFALLALLGRRSLVAAPLQVLARHGLQDRVALVEDDLRRGSQRELLRVAGAPEHALLHAQRILAPLLLRLGHPQEVLEAALRRAGVRRVVHAAE